MPAPTETTMLHLPSGTHQRQRATVLVTSLVVFLFIVATNPATARPPQPTQRPPRTQTATGDDVSGWQPAEPLPLMIGANSLPSRQPSSPSTSILSRPTQQQQHQFGMMPGSRMPNNVPPQHQPSLNNPYTDATHAILLDLRQQLINKEMKFNEHFRSLLSQSKLSLHNMFVQTYGLMYEHNTEIFISMYENLEKYYNTGQVELTKSMESFFLHLYQKIFQVANSNRVFSPTYLECVAEHLTILKPFKDLPDKLIVDIRQTLVAARTFNQALNSAMDIIKSIISLGDPPQCIKLISEKLLSHQFPIRGTTRELTPSGQPTGISNANMQMPCPNFCEQVIRRCVGRANLDPLDESWRRYVTALADLAKKLSVQYNTETTIGPLDVQISEAIMNFQENSQNITQRIYSACGEAKPNNGQQSSLSNVTPMRTPPVQNQPRFIGKREAIASRPPSPVSASGSSHGYPKQRQQTSLTPHGRSQSQATSLRQTDGVVNQPLPVTSTPSNDFDQARSMQIRPMFPISSSSPTNHVSYERPKATSNVNSHAASLYDPYFDDAAPGMPVNQLSRKSAVIIGDIRDYLLSTKNFWSSLPNSVCNITLSANITNIGQAQKRNSQQNCFQENLEIYDMNSDIKYGFEIRQQVQRLDAMHARILDALRGVEIDWSKVSDTIGNSVPNDRAQQSNPIRPPQSNGAQPLPPYAPQPDGGPSVSSVPTDEEPDSEESIEPIDDEDGSGDSENDESDATPLPDDYEEDPNPDDNPEHVDDPPLTTQANDLTTDSPPQDNTLYDNDGRQTAAEQSTDPLITVDPNTHRSSADPISRSLMRTRMSLLFVSIIYYALSVVIQNQYRPMTMLKASA